MRVCTGEPEGQHVTAESSHDPATESGDVAESGMRQPHLALLHASMLLSGFGTVFLGPMLPALAASAHTTDSGSGLFFTAQFLGAFCGGITTSARLWRSLLRGTAGAALGFLILAVCTARQLSLPCYLLALLLLGFGVGQTLTSVNLLVAQRSTRGRGAALSLVNFSWSLGAVTAPVLLGWVLTATSPAKVLLVIAALFAAAFAGAAANARLSVGTTHAAAREAAPAAHLAPSAFLHFCTLLILYGGVETALSGWVTTFGSRYGGGALHVSALPTTALWVGLTAGRALAPLLLRRASERTLISASLVSAILMTAALSLSTGVTGIVVLCALLGLALAPWFPLVLASMLAEGAAARQVGIIVAMSGVGAATIPLLVGLVSQRAASLRVALLVPLLGLVCLLLLTFWHSRSTRHKGTR